jgi:hypothetical protein
LQPTMKILSEAPDEEHFELVLSADDIKTDPINLDSEEAGVADVASSSDLPRVDARREVLRAAKDLDAWFSCSDSQSTGHVLPEDNLLPKPDEPPPLADTDSGAVDEFGDLDGAVKVFVGAPVHGGSPLSMELVLERLLEGGPKLALFLKHLASPENPEWRCEERSRLSKYFLRSKTLVKSSAAEAESMGVSVGKLTRGRKQLAMAALIVHHGDALQAMRYICDNVQSLGGELVLFTERSMYDETPMRVKVRDLQTSQQCRVLSLVAAGDRPRSLGIAAATDTGMAKLLVMTWNFSLLVRLGNKHLHFRFEILTTLQAMENTKARVYFECIKQSRPKVDVIAHRFHRKQRLVITDRASAIDKAERALIASPLYADYTLLHIKCLMHRFSNIQTKVFDQFGLPISCIIHVAVSLQYSSGMARFRASFRSVLADKFHFVRGGWPSEEALCHRRRCLDKFFSGDNRQAVLRRHVVEGLANGDWRSDAVVTHHCHGCCLSEQHSLDRMCLGEISE